MEPGWGRRRIARGGVPAPGKAHPEAEGRMDPTAWCVAGVRPANHPRRRIAGAARMLSRYVDSGFLPTLDPLVAREKLGDLCHAFAVAGDGQGTLIGQGRAADIVVNVALPLLHAQAVAEGKRAVAASCLRVAEAAPRLEDNELTREMVALLSLPARRIAVGALRQQGLIHLYRRLLERGVSSAGSPALLREDRGVYRVAGASRRVPAPQGCSTGEWILVSWRVSCPSRSLP